MTDTEGNATIELARCTGHCCRGFNVPVIEAYGGLDKFRAAWADEADSEARIIADMLTPLPKATIDDPQTYDCKHHKAATGDCGIYATRPRMCSAFPYDGQPCEKPGCTRRTA